MRQHPIVEAGEYPSLLLKAANQSHWTAAASSQATGAIPKRPKPTLYVARVNGGPKAVCLDESLAVFEPVIHCANHNLLQLPPIADLLCPLDDLSVEQRAEELDSLGFTAPLSRLTAWLVQLSEAA